MIIIPPIITSGSSNRDVNIKVPSKLNRNQVAGLFVFLLWLSSLAYYLYKYSTGSEADEPYYVGVFTVILFTPFVLFLLFAVLMLIFECLED